MPQEWNYDETDQLHADLAAAFPSSAYMDNDDYYEHKHFNPAQSQGSRQQQPFPSACQTGPPFIPVATYPQPPLTFEAQSVPLQPQQQDYFQPSPQEYHTTMPPSSISVSPTTGPGSIHSSIVPSSPLAQPSSSTSGPQIRFNENMMNLSGRRQHSIPLDPNTSAR